MSEEKGSEGSGKLPYNPEEALASVANLDAARLTLRWALERIHFLETSHSESLDLLKESYSARDRANKELEALKKSVEDRTKGIAQKERLVTEMQTMLNDLFKGQISVKDFLQERQKVDDLKNELEAKANAKIADLEARHRQQLEAQAKHFSELEASYRKSLADARKQFEADVADLERRHHEDSIAERGQQARFKETLLEQVQKESDQFQQKMLLMQAEYTAKRRELQHEYDKLKEKVIEESKHFESKQSYALRLAEGRWTSERKALEDELKRQTERIQKQEEELRALQEENRRLAPSQAREISKLLKALGERGAKGEAAADLFKLQEHVREHMAAEIEQELKAHDETLRRQQDAMRQLEQAFYDREQRRVKDLEQRLKAEQAFYEAEIARLREAQQAMSVDHARQLDQAQLQLRGMQEQLQGKLVVEAEQQAKLHNERLRKQQQALQEVAERYESEIASLRRQNREQVETYSAEVANLSAKLRKLQESFDSQLAAEIDGRLKNRTEELKRQYESIQSTDRGLLENERKRSQELDTRLRSLEENHIKALQSARQEYQDSLAKNAREMEDYVEMQSQQLQQKIKALKDENIRVSELYSREVEESSAKLNRLQETIDTQQRDLKHREMKLTQDFNSRAHQVEQLYKGEVDKLKHELFKVQEQLKKEQHKGKASPELQERINNLERQTAEDSRKLIQAEKENAELRLKQSVFEKEFSKESGDLERGIELAQKERGEFQARVNELETAQKKLEQQLAAKQDFHLQEMERLRQEYERDAASFAERMKSIKASDAVTEQIKLLEEDYRRKMDGLRERIAHFSDERDSEKVKRNDVEKQLAAARQQIQQLQAEVQTLNITAAAQQAQPAVDPQKLRELGERLTKVQMEHQLQLQALEHEKDRLAQQLAAMEEESQKAAQAPPPAPTPDSINAETEKYVQEILMSHAQELERVRAAHTKELEQTGIQVQRQRMTIVDLMKQLEEFRKQLPKT